MPMAQGTGDVNVSLVQLKELIKRDPEAYESEFKLQLEHFKGHLGLHELTPERPNHGFHELTIFLAQTAPYYGNGACDNFYKKVANLIQTRCQQIHPQTLHAMTTALMFMRKSNKVDMMELLPVWFDIIGSKDRVMRTVLYLHIIQDISRLMKRDRSTETFKRISDFVISKVSHPNVIQQRRAVAILMELNRRRVWTDGRIVNVIGNATLASDNKVCMSACNFLLGNKAPTADAIDDDEDPITVKDLVKRICHSKNKKKQKLKLERTKLAAQRQLKRQRQKQFDPTISSAVIDLIYDPEQLATQILGRVKKHEKTFHCRVTFLNVVSRLIARHRLLLLEFYPLLQRYLNPKQQEITRFLAMLVEAVHDAVPPQEVRTTLRVLVDRFIADVQPHEVIAVGLNTVREICSRSVTVLDADMLADLCRFMKLKNKSVRNAAKGLVNLYRERYPRLLHPSLRGKEAAIAVQEQRDRNPQYGVPDLCESVPGVHLLIKAEALKEAREQQATENLDFSEEASSESSVCDEDDSSTEHDEDDRSEHNEDEVANKHVEEARIASRKRPYEENGVVDPRTLSMTRILTNEDFKRIRMMNMQLNTVRSMGRLNKRQQLNASSDIFEFSSADGSDPSDDVDSCESVDDDNGAGDFSTGASELMAKIPEACCPAELEQGVKKTRTKQQRLQKLKDSKTNFRTNMKQNKRERMKFKSKPNRVQARSKPLMMVRQSRSVQDKVRNRGSGEKVKALVQHIRKLKNATGSKNRRWRR